MSVERIYFADQKFVLTLIYGKLTNSELALHVSEMNNEYNCISGIREIADCRYLEDVSELTQGGLFGSAHMEHGSTRTIGGRGAIVADNDLIFGLASMYAGIAANIREDSRVFRVMSEALDWMQIEAIRPRIEELLSKEAYQHRITNP